MSTAQPAVDSLRNAQHPSQPVDAIRMIHADKVAAQAWRNGGGQTRELLAWPDAAEWRLRISRADIEADGPFSAFPGVQRWFVVMSGHGVVLHMPTPDGHTRDHRLLPGHAPLHFDGVLAPGCSLVQGPTQDLNLMARGGRAGMQAVDANQAWLSSHAMCGIYTACAGIWTYGSQSLPLVAHTLLWMEQAPAAPMRFSPDHSSPALAWWLGYTPEATA